MNMSFCPSISSMVQAPKFCRLTKAFVRENERTWSEATAPGGWCWTLICFADQWMTNGSKGTLNGDL